MSSNSAGPTRRILGAWPLDQKLVNSQLSMGTAATRVSTGYPLRVSAGSREQRLLRLRWWLHWCGRELAPIRDFLHTVATLQLICSTFADALGQRKLFRCCRLVHLVLGELLLQSVVVVRDFQAVLTLQKARSDHQAILVILHGKFKGNSTADKIPHLVKHGAHLYPASATLVVWAMCLEGSRVAAKLSKKEWLGQIGKLLRNILIG
mmetsp:Transcript_68333/g.150239  ORF Transcript_68333/g.150239 Transcript_68333/m.150239 type:complete len:207 (+) Transcript_68333:49-669(+)